MSRYDNAIVRCHAICTHISHVTDSQSHNSKLGTAQLTTMRRRIYLLFISAPVLFIEAHAILICYILDASLCFKGTMLNNFFIFFFNFKLKSFNDFFIDALVLDKSQNRPQSKEWAAMVFTWCNM